MFYSDFCIDCAQHGTVEFFFFLPLLFKSEGTKRGNPRRRLPSSLLPSFNKVSGYPLIESCSPSWIFRQEENWREAGASSLRLLSREGDGQRIGRTLTRILLDQTSVHLWLTCRAPGSSLVFLFPWRWFSHLMPLHSRPPSS